MRHWHGFLAGIVLVLSRVCGHAQSDAVPAKSMADALSWQKWGQLQKNVDRALAWIASQQNSDGSFPTISPGQPAITSLCVMAFLSRGHQPGFGPYGQQLNRAVDYVLSCQKEDGLISLDSPGAEFVERTASHTATYNHAISGLMLGEVYGHVTGQRARNVRKAIAKAIPVSRGLQTRPKYWPTDAGGVRYVRLKDAIARDGDVLGHSVAFDVLARG